VKQKSESEEWENLWTRYINSLVARDEIKSAYEKRGLAPSPTRHQLRASELRVAKSIRAIERIDKRFADAVCDAYWM